MEVDTARLGSTGEEKLIEVTTDPSSVVLVLVEIWVTLMVAVLYGVAVDDVAVNDVAVDDVALLVVIVIVFVVQVYVIVVERVVVVLVSVLDTDVVLELLVAVILVPVLLVAELLDLVLLVVDVVDVLMWTVLVHTGPAGFDRSHVTVTVEASQSMVMMFNVSVVAVEVWHSARPLAKHANAQSA